MILPRFCLFAAQTRACIFRLGFATGSPINNVCSGRRGELTHSYSKYLYNVTSTKIAVVIRFQLTFLQQS